MEVRGIVGAEVRYELAFQDDFMIIKAAVAGQGLELLHDVYVSDELRNGTLAKACSAACQPILRIMPLAMQKQCHALLSGVLQNG